MPSWLDRMPWTAEELDKHIEQSSDRTSLLGQYAVLCVADSFYSGLLS